MTYNIFIFLTQSIYKSKFTDLIQSGIHFANGAFIMTLTKADVIDSVKDQIGFTRKKSVETIETLLETIKSTLESGEDVLISGFGKFCVRNKKKRRGRNPATGDDMVFE